MATKLTKKNSTPVKPNTKPKAARLQAKVKNFTRAVGRRKTAIAQVRLFEGKQEIVVNGKPITTYWGRPDLSSIYMRAFVITDTVGKYSATVKVVGGGVLGQIDAFNHAVARAFVTLDPEKFKKSLREAGLITRDPRMKETRKVGQAGKARKKKQSPKR